MNRITYTRGSKSYVVHVEAHTTYTGTLVIEPTDDIDNIEEEIMDLVEKNHNLISWDLSPPDVRALNAGLSVYNVEPYLPRD